MGIFQVTALRRAASRPWRHVGPSRLTGDGRGGKLVTMTAPSTIVFFHAHPDDEVVLTGGSMARASTEGIASCSSWRRTASTARSRTISPRARRSWPADAGDGVLRRGPRRPPRPVARLQRLGDDRVGPERPSRLALAGRRRRRRRPARQAARGGARRRPRHLRLARRLRTSRSRPVPPGRPPRRRPRRHATGARSDVQPRHDAGVRRRAKVGAEWDPDGPADDGNPFGTPEIEIHYRRRRRRVRRPQATGAGVPRQPDERRRSDAGDARGGVRPGLRHRVVHRAGPAARAAS